ncbi:MAG: chromate transporter [Solobacterium sp.]|nr:chromate transporter [Solobacterium sp.]
MKTFLLMCWEYFKTGLFAVGGGYATIPFLREMSLRYGWFTLEDITTMVAVSESTPGPVGVNMATYVGYSMFGIPGAIAATLSLVAPSIIVICIIASILERFKQAEVVQGIFTGLRPAVVGFVLSAVLSIFLVSLFHIDAVQSGGGLASLFNWKSILLFAVLLGVKTWKKDLHPIALIAAAAVAGIVFAF